MPTTASRLKFGCFSRLDCRWQPIWIGPLRRTVVVLQNPISSLNAAGNSQQLSDRRRVPDLFACGDEALARQARELARVFRAMAALRRQTRTRQMLRKQHSAKGQKLAFKDRDEGREVAIGATPAPWRRTGSTRTIAPSKPVPNPPSRSDVVILSGLTTVRQLLLFSAERSGCEGQIPVARKRNVRAPGTVDYLICGKQLARFWMNWISRRRLATVDGGQSEIWMCRSGTFMV